MGSLDRALLGAVLVALAACARGDGVHWGTRVTGRLVDDETGAAVSRQTFWIHGFNDEIDHQVSLEPGDHGSSFSMVLPTPNIRLRIADKEDAYGLYEERFVGRDRALDVEVRLKPTHWIRLHGRVLWRDRERLRPFHEGDKLVLSAIINVGPSEIRVHEDSTYSVRVPRELVDVMTLDTNRGAHPRTIDLRGTSEVERPLDIVLEE